MTSNIESSITDTSGQMLYNAIENADIQTVRFICENTPSLVAEHYDSCTISDVYSETLPLYHAWSIAYDDNKTDGRIDILYLLIKYSDLTDVNIQCQNILHVAAFTGDIYICDVGIQYEVELNDMDNNGKTPYEYAVEANNHKIADLLYINGGV